MPSRLWEFFAEQSGIKNEWRWADLPSAEQNKFIKNLCSYECEVKGKTTFKEEFVTAGGIKLNEVDANTMMSKKIPNLFFAGEVLDVDGITGGFNFQHAWTSGWVAAKSIAEIMVISVNAKEFFHSQRRLRSTWNIESDSNVQECDCNGCQIKALKLSSSSKKLSTSNS